jgi:cysteinyl-tRNA synthetase
MAQVVYNTLSKKKEPFTPQHDPIRMYVCGPTVYDLLHIGNFRGAIFFNLVRNWLEHQGKKVNYVYNYTDVDDKIIKRSHEKNMTPGELSEKYIQEFEKDFSNLKLKPHDHNPRVTEYIQPIIKMIEGIIEKKKAYVIDGEVFYAIDEFKTYGQLSGKKLDELEAGQRVEVDQRKKNPFDFVLWKPSKEGEPSWDSPWGPGRPGWHIECSAMIHEILGETIDIHGGGIDLIFPHHENEIAQGEGCCDQTYCHYWMHNNFLNINNEKMSKSLGNMITARAFMEQYHPEILKYLMLSSHYRVLLNIDDDKINQTIVELDRIYRSIRDAQSDLKHLPKGSNFDANQVDKGLAKILRQGEVGITKALNDDFNTPLLISQIFECLRAYNKLRDQLKKKQKEALAHSAHAYLEFIRPYSSMMSLFEEQPESFLTFLDDLFIQDRDFSRADVDKLIADRAQARADKDWDKADQVRDQLNAWGIEVFDSPEGVSWSIKKS